MPSFDTPSAAPVSDPNEIAVESLQTSVTRIPGAAVETVVDREANAARRSEPENASEIPVPDRVVQTATPALNYQSRTNIVAAGPGSVGDDLTAGELRADDPAYPGSTVDDTRSLGDDSRGVTAE